MDRPKIAEKYRTTPADRDAFLNLLDHDAIPLPHHAAAGVCRDPDDDYLLGCAARARIEYLVTGDDDLLTPKRFEIVVILTARDCLTIVARCPLPWRRTLAALMREVGVIRAIV